AVHVNEVEFAVLARIALLREPLVEHQVVLLEAFGRIATRSLAPNDERSPTIWCLSCDGAEPPTPIRIFLEPRRELKPPRGIFGEIGIIVSFECRNESARRRNVPNGEADEPAESFNEVHVHFARLV